MRLGIRLLAVLIGLAMLLVGSSGLAHADDMTWKEAHDTDPHLALTPEQLAMTAEKRAAEENGDVAAVSGALGFGALAADGAASPAPWVTCGSCGGGGNYPSSASLTANQSPQITGYYCGPASVHEALGAVGVSLSQSAAATELHTTTAGTAWSGAGTSPSGYPVPDVLNRHQGRNYYVPQYVSSPTASALNTYENDLRMDIYAVRAPLIGDAWEVPGGPHLVGHPLTQQIFHWFEIRGYQSSAASTMYEDSVHNARSIAWYASVPAYSTLPSSQIVTIVAGRGYVW
jgi:hypothetical protein